MNKLIAIAAFAFAAITTPALAGTLSAEGRTALAPNAAGVDLSASGLNAGPVTLGAEVQSVQASHNGAVVDLFSVNATKTFASVDGFTPQVGVEVGKSVSTAKDFGFWGLDAGVSHAVAGPVTASVGYRYRQGFADRKLEENRLNAGLTYAVSKATSLGLNYYRYDEKYVPVHVRKVSNVVGVGVNYNF